MSTTAWNQHWGGYETLKCCLTDPRDLKVTKNAYFSPFTHNMQLLFVTFCDTTAGFGASFRTHEIMNGQKHR